MLLDGGSATTYYVNDASTDNDAWATTPGNDNNDGLSPATPKATVQDVLADYDLGPGDVVRIDTGTYFLFPKITVDTADGGDSLAPVTFVASPFGVTMTANRNGYNTWNLMAPYVTLTTAVLDPELRPGVPRSWMKITGGGAYGVHIEGDYAMVSRCDVTANTYAGISVKSATGVTIENNLVRGNGIGGGYGYGILLTSAADATLQNNTIYGNGDISVYFTYSATAVFRNNVVVASGSDRTAIGLAASTLAVSDYNNLFVRDGATVNGTNCASLAEWRRASGKDLHSLSLDPLFVDPTNGDFHLQSTAGSYHGGAWTEDEATSPCIDTGYGDAGSESRPAGVVPKPPDYQTPLHAANLGQRNLGAYGGTEQASGTLLKRQLWLYEPIGGEVYASSPQNIRWTWVGADWQSGAPVSLESSADAGSTWSAISGAAALAVDAATFEWDISDYESKPVYRVRATPSPEPTGANGSSRNFQITFDRIAPVAPVVTDPPAPVTVNVDTYQIQGTAEASSLVQVYVDADNNNQVDVGETVAGAQQLIAFDGDGRLISPSAGWGCAVAVQVDGKILLGGFSSNVSGYDFDFALERYNRDGSLDTSFDGDGRVTTDIGLHTADQGFSIAVQGDGKILLGGRSEYLANEFALVRYNPDGSLDISFDGDGKLTTKIGWEDEGYSVAVQPDGKILLGGSSWDGSSGDFALVRYNADGSLDTSFHGDGKLTTAIPVSHEAGLSVVVQSDGKILVGGHSGINLAVARYNADGSLDVSFDGDGMVTTPLGGAAENGFNSLAVQADGKILLGGYSANGGTWDFALVRYNADGSLDTTFDGDGKLTTAIGASGDLAYGMAVQADGKILLGGHTDNGSNCDFALARYNSDGSLDTTFDNDGKLTTHVGGAVDAGFAVAVQPDGKILLGGGSDDHFAMVRYNPDGSLDDGTRFSMPVPLMQNAANNFVVTAADAAGNVSPAADVPTITEDSQSPAAPQVTDPPAPVTVNADTYQVQGTAEANSLVQVYEDADNNGQVDVGEAVAGQQQLIAFDGDGKLITQVGPSVDTGFSLAVQADGKILLGGQGWDSIPSFCLVRYNADGSLDTSFGGDGKLTTTIGTSDDAGYSVAVQADGKILLGGRSWKNGNGDDFALVRYNTDGSLDTTFDDDGKLTTQVSVGKHDVGRSLALQADGKIVLGGYSGLYGNMDFALVRYNADGSLDTSFDGDGKVITSISSSNDYGRSVAIQADGAILLGGESNGDFALVRYNPGGSLDVVVTPIGLLSDDQGYSVAVQSDGKILLGGHSWNGQDFDFAIVRYNADLSLDTGFDGDGKLTTSFGASHDRGYSVAVQADGKILLAGESDGYFAAVRYNADGSLDTSFHGDGRLTTQIGTQDSTAYSVTLQSDAKILLGGASEADYTTYFSAARYTAEGDLDDGTRFSIPVPLTQNAANNFVVTGTDVAGNVSPAADVPTITEDSQSPAVPQVTDPPAPVTVNADTYHVQGTAEANSLVQAYLDADNNGQVDVGETVAGAQQLIAFDADGKVVTEIGAQYDSGRSVAVQADGRILIGGTSGNNSWARYFALARYNADGSLDTTFDRDGKLITALSTGLDFGYSVGVQGDGKILLAGVSDVGSNTDFALVRYNADGSLDTSFDGDGKVTTDLGGGDAAFSMAVQTDGRILLGGDSNGDFALVRYHTDGSLDTTFGGDGIVTTDFGNEVCGRSVVIQADGKILLAGYYYAGFIAGYTKYDFALARYNADGSLDTTFDGDGKLTTAIGPGRDYGYSVAVQADGKILLGGYCYAGSDDDFALVRYNADGSLDTTFAGDGKLTTAIGVGDDHAQSVVVQADGKIVVGGASVSGGGTDFALVRYNSDGSLDTSFGTDGKVLTAINRYGSANGVAIQSDGKYLLAGQTSGFGTKSYFALVRYNVDGSLDDGGHFAISVPLRQDAANNFVVTATDAAGNVSPAADVPKIIEDSQPPAVTVASLITNDTTPAITGTVSDGTLQVAVNGRTYTAGDGNLSVSGTNWTLQIPGGDALACGAYNIMAAATDAAGNVGADSTTDELQIVKLIVTSLTPTASGFVAQFSGEFQLADLNLYDGAGGIFGPADVALQDSANQVVAGSLVLDSSRQAITFVKTGGVLAPGTYTVTLNSGLTAFRAMDDDPLDGNNDGTTGDDFTAQFTVTSSADRIVSVPDMARGAGQSVDIPNPAAGLPIRLDNAQGVTSLAVDLVYDEDLLNITAATLAAGLPGDWAVVNPPDTGTPGVAKVRASGTTPLAGTNIDVVRLTAAVPSDASYGAIQAIRLENVLLNGGTIAAVGDVAVHKAVYLGDADGSGIHSSADAFLTVQAALGLASGFAAHAWTDPRIVGDADGSGVLSAADAFLVVQEGLGLAEPFVPDNPHIAVTPVGGGVDPQFQIDANLAASAGGMVTVPVKLAIEAAATNVGGFDFDLFFDPSRLTIQLREGVSAGADTAGWAVSAALVAPGQLRVGMVSSRGQPLAPGLREIARLQFRVAASVPDAVPLAERAAYDDSLPVSERSGYVVGLDIEPVDASAGGYTWTDADGSALIRPAKRTLAGAVRERVWRDVDARADLLESVLADLVRDIASAWR